MANKLPKSYAIKCTVEDPRWGRYISSLNVINRQRGECAWNGTSPNYWYGCSEQGTFVRYDISADITRLTLDQWEELSKETSNLPEYYAIQCTDPNDPRWKRYIAQLNSTQTTSHLFGTSIGNWYGFQKDRAYQNRLLNSFISGTLVLTLDQWEKLVPPEEFVVPSQWCIAGSKQLQEWISANTVQKSTGQNPETYYYPIYPDLKSWSLLHHLNTAVRPAITFDQFIKYIAKPAVPAFDKDNWVIAVDTPEKRKEVAEWIDAQKSDRVSLMGHTMYGDHAYFGWITAPRGQQLWIATDNPQIKRLITWEQFLTLKTPPTMDAPAPAPATQRIQRIHAKLIYDNVCEDWQEYILKVLKEGDQFSDEVSVPTADIIRGHKEAKPEQKKMLEEYFIVPVEDKNALLPDISRNRIRDISTSLFNNPYALDVLAAETPKDRPELEGRALYIRADYKVETGSTPSGGTWITVHKK